MSLGVGLDAQFGLALETEYGTYVAPDTFYELRGSESVSPLIINLESEGLGRGRFLRLHQSDSVIRGAAGDTPLYPTTVGFGVPLLLAMGAVDASQPDEINQPNHWLNRFTPSASGLRGISASGQIGVPATDGTIHPKSMRGGKVVNWELAFGTDAYVQANFTWDFLGFTTDELLETAVYPADLNLFTFVSVEVELGGTVVTIQEVTLSPNNALQVDRWGLGNRKNEPLPDGRYELGISFSKDFENMDIYNDFMNGATAKLIVTASRGEIDEGQENPFMLKSVIEHIEYRDPGVNVGGPGVVDQSPDAVAVFDGTNDIFAIEYHTDTEIVIPS